MTAWEEMMTDAVGGDRTQHVEAGLLMGAGSPQAQALKFADLLPDEIQREVLWKQHYDIPAAVGVMDELERRLVLAADEGGRV